MKACTTLPPQVILKQHETPLAGHRTQHTRRATHAGGNGDRHAETEHTHGGLTPSFGPTEERSQGQKARAVWAWAAAWAGEVGGAGWSCVDD